MLIILLFLCVLCLASLALTLAGVRGAASALGRFLLESFSWAGFFVPLYLLAGATLLVRPVFRRRSALLLMCSIIPFLTLSLLFHVLSRSASLLPQLMLDSFGVVPSALLLFLLLALETIFLFTLPYGGGAAAVRAPQGKRLALPFVPLEELAPLSPPLVPGAYVERPEELEFQEAPPVAARVPVTAPESAEETVEEPGDEILDEVDEEPAEASAEVDEAPVLPEALAFPRGKPSAAHTAGPSRAGGAAFSEDGRGRQGLWHPRERGAEKPGQQRVLADRR